MAEIYSVMTRKGQITVPAVIRQSLGLREGDHLAMSLTSDGEQILVRRVVSPIEATYGKVTTGPRPAVLADVRDEVAEEVGRAVAAEGAIDDTSADKPAVSRR